MMTEALMWTAAAAIFSLLLTVRTLTVKRGLLWKLTQLRNPEKDDAA